MPIAVVHFFLVIGRVGARTFLGREFDRPQVKELVLPAATGIASFFISLLSSSPVMTGSSSDLVTAVDNLLAAVARRETDGSVECFVASLRGILDACRNEQAIVKEAEERQRSILSHDLQRIVKSVDDAAGRPPFPNPVPPAMSTLLSAAVHALAFVLPSLHVLDRTGDLVAYEQSLSTTERAMLSRWQKSLPFSMDLPVLATAIAISPMDPVQGPDDVVLTRLASILVATHSCVKQKMTAFAEVLRNRPRLRSQGVSVLVHLVFGLLDESAV